MKTKRGTTIFFLLLTAGMFISLAGFSQRYRYGYHGSYYDYPARAFSYVHPYLTIPFGGYNYYYQYGSYYRPYGAYFGLVVPPLGLRIATLPFGYSNFYYGPDPYYYYNGTFYRPYNRQYEVVAPPLGAVVDKLPHKARAQQINGEKYYEYGGTYYQEQVGDHDRVTYKVVGTKGVLNTGTSSNNSSLPKIGDRVDELPADSKSVIINGDQLYSTPAGLYYKKVVDGDKVFYELVGK